jgi:probable addiction module antidote protein
MLPQFINERTGIARAQGDIARATVMAQVARDAGLSRESLYKALRENGNPSFATVLKVAIALGVMVSCASSLRRRQCFAPLHPAHTHAHTRIRVLQAVLLSGVCHCLCGAGARFSI